MSSLNCKLMHAIPGSSSASNLLLLDVHEICPSTINISILRTRFRYKPSLVLQAACQAYIQLVKVLMVLYVVHGNSRSCALLIHFVCVCERERERLAALPDRKPRIKRILGLERQT